MFYKFFYVIFLLLFIFFNCYSFSQDINRQKYRLAQSYEENGMLKEAQLLLEELIKSEPKNFEYFYSFANVMKKQNKYSELLPYTEEFYKNQANNEIKNLLAELYWRSGKTKEANNLWNDIISKSKDQLDFQIVSQTQIELKIFDKAINTLISYRNISKDSYAFSDALIKLYILTNNYKDGFDEIISALRFNNDLALAQGRIYAFLVNEESNNYIDEQLKKLVRSNNDNLGILEIYAWFCRTIGNYDEALNIYIRMDEIKRTNGYELINFANISSRDGQYDIAIKAYQIVIQMGKNTPYLSNALYGYTKALEDRLLLNKESIKESDFKDIIKSYNQVIKDFPKTAQAADAKLRIAQIKAENLNKIKDAIDELISLYKEYPNSNQSMQGAILISKYYMKIGQLNESEDWAKKVIENKKIVNNDLVDDANYLLALKSYYSGLIEDALAKFKLLAANSDFNSSNDALQKIFFIEENKNFIKALPKFINAEYLEFQQKYDEAIELYSEVSKEAKKSNLGETSLFEVANIYILKKLFPEARNTLNKILSDYNGSIREDYVIYLIAESFYLENNHSEALKYYTELLSKFPNSIYLNDSRNKIRIIRKEKL
jgi:tetratricopeptide (TPR) repeat protein